MADAVLICGNDNVITLMQEAKEGEEVFCPELGRKIKAVCPIPIYHKMAVCDIKRGDVLYKYGEAIGYATADIREGEHVHTQNLDSKKP